MVGAAAPRGGLPLRDLIIAAVMILILAILFLPLPTWMLDFLIVINIVMAILIVFVALYIVRPLEFASFPSLLLLTALYRLALSVATSRSILLNGEAGHVIETMAEFVMGGNYIVGIIIFIILIIVNFIVITEGAKRIAEVAARFTLDAMPGKQMSIDADLASGLIDGAQAKKRREEIVQEANFFGSMDGANKFVKGDVIASIILIVVNIVGGILIGILMKKIDVMTALSKYAILTVGDGLVGLIPGILISISAGLVSSRAASDQNLAADLKNQVFTNPKSLGIAGAVSFLVAFVPGFPKQFFIPIGLLLGGAAFVHLRRQMMPQLPSSDLGGGGLPLDDVIDDYQPDADEDYKNPDNVMKMMGVPPLTLELGLDLVPLVDPGLGGELMDRVIPMRVNIALDMGFVMPPIVFKDNLNLEPNSYQILVKGNTVASGELLVGYMLAIRQATTDNSQELVGFATQDPAFGKPAVWVAGAEAQRAAQLGYLIQDPTNVLTAHLEHTVRTHANELLYREDLQRLLDLVRQKAAVTVKDLIPEVLALSEVHRVLQSLLREGVSIRDLTTILERLTDFGKMTKDVFLLTELIRQQLSRQICASVAGEERTIDVITLDPGVENTVQSSITSSPTGPQAAVNPQIMQLILARLASVHQEATGRGSNPVLLTNPVIRPHVKNLVERNFPTLAVLSYAEVHASFKVQSVGQVSIAVGVS
ncbi:MAG: flagellar biosynthesis protein FlhA [bacterium]|nr:flagellar biosynthesis protein FlhA [bacterium]